MGLFISETEVVQLKKLSKKKIIPIIIIAIALVVLVVVFGVSKNSKKQNKESKYKSLDKVIAEQEDVLKNEYDNLILPDKITVVKPDKLYEIYMDRDNALKDTSDEAKSKIYPLIREFTNGAMEESDVYVDEANSFRFSFDEEKNKNYIGVINANGVGDITSKEAMYVRANTTKHKETIFVKYGENTDVTYDIAGEQYSVKDAIAYCEKYLKEINYYNYCPEGFELKPSYVVVYGTKGSEKEPPADAKETHYYKVYFDMYLDGVPLNDTGCINEEKYFSYSAFMMQIDKKDNVGCIQRLAQIVPQKKTELEGKFITLESCLKNVSEWLSKGHKYEVKEIGMRYCSIEEIGFTEKIARPYWRIVLQEYEGDEVSAVHSRSVYVDVQTGDMYLFDSKNGEMLTPDKD